MTTSPSHSPIRPAVALLALAAPLALAGCNWDREFGNEFQYGSHTARIDAETGTGQFAWHQTDLSHLVRFSPGAAAMAPDEAVQLNHFIDQVGVQSNDEVTATVGGPMGGARADAVQQAFALRGYRITPTVDPYLADGDVTVTIRRVVYTAAACLTEGSRLADGTPSMPFGCANALNLQRMVANPDELVEGGLGSDTVETVPAVGAIQRYRRGEITPLINSSTTEE